jgi:predicted transcriptional regulator
MSEDAVPIEGLIAHTTDIVQSYLGNNSLAADEMPAFIRNIYDTLCGLCRPAAVPEKPVRPAVPIRSSVKHDHIVCLEDGRKFMTLRRHLRVGHGMTPDEYRARWGLASDYPLIAPDYAQSRRAIAKRIGLGRDPQQRRGRRKATDA